jgi:hypothetical protein
MMSARMALLLIAILAIAGCSAPSAVPSTPDSQSGTATPRQDYSTTTPVTSSPDSPKNGSTIPVVGGQIDADQDHLFQRVIQQRNVDVQPPERIQVVDPESADSPVEPPRFLQLFGVETPESKTGLSGQTIGEDLIRINQSIATTPRIKGVLVHEYTHIIQNQRGTTGQMFESGTMDLIPPFGVERPLLIRTVKEGAATYIADKYQRSQTDTLRQGKRYERLYQQRDTAGGRYLMAPYWFGYRYVADRVANNGTVNSVYTQPPQTTEAIIHGYEPGSEPPANLSVDVTTDQWEQNKRGRVGELGTRIALSASLNRTNAANSAAGWGNDVLLIFENETATGYAWMARWDDTENETEFRTALRTALDRQATRTDTRWRDGNTTYRVRQGDARTTVVLVGPSEFVQNTSVELDGAAVVRGP